MNQQNSNVVSGREIKFRAWDKVNEIMENNIQVFHEFVTMLTKDRYVIMQYAGLKDKIGKEIYEGDICNFNSGKIFEHTIKVYVLFSNSSFCSKSPTYNSALITDKIRDGKLIHYEIIGNIYENSELLNNKL